MLVVKRDARTEPVQFDKITARIKKLCYELHESVDPTKVAMRVIEGVYDGVTTTELDNLAAEVAATNAVTHPDYASLASRIAVSNLHKGTKKSFAETMEDLYTYVDPITGENASLVANDVIEIIRDNAEFLDSQIIYDRDFNYDYFGFKTLERSYLLKINNEIVERPSAHAHARGRRHSQGRPRCGGGRTTDSAKAGSPTQLPPCSTPERRSPRCPAASC